MRRFVSIWLPRWPIERRRRDAPNPPAATGRPASGRPASPPLALTAASRHGQRLTAVDPAAERAGLAAGMPLADARALCPGLLVEPADPAGDGYALRRLALWCGRLSPWTAVDGADGIALDITGCAHLFGGEAALLADLRGRLHGFGLSARLAAAPTLGAARAVARHGPDAIAMVSDGAIADTLAPLPLAALRLDDATAEALARLGLKRIGDLLGQPTAPLAARFGPDLGRRLDEAMGRRAETVHGLLPPPLYEARRIFAEPIVLTGDVELTVADLATDLAARLDGAGVGARRLDLRLYRVDGRVRVETVRTAELCRHADHMVRLFRERLGGDAEELDTGFGIELATLGAAAVEPVVARQDALEPGAGTGRKGTPAEIARLVDRLGNRFGFDRVVTFAPEASALPERAVRAVPALYGQQPADWGEHLRALQGGRHLGRPLLLLAEPDPVQVLAEVPDGPPVRFEWQRTAHRVTRVDGPERLAPEWWRPPAAGSRQTRDYYRVEDSEGRRFWLYREGLYDRADDTPRWFLHGLFA